MNAVSLSWLHFLCSKWVWCVKNPFVSSPPLIEKRRRFFFFRKPHTLRFLFSLDSLSYVHKIGKTYKEIVVSVTRDVAVVNHAEGKAKRDDTNFRKFFFSNAEATALGNSKENLSIPKSLHTNLREVTLTAWPKFENARHCEGMLKQTQPTTGRQWWPPWGTN